MSLKLSEREGSIGRQWVVVLLWYPEEQDRTHGVQVGSPQQVCTGSDSLYVLGLECFLLPPAILSTCNTEHQQEQWLSKAAMEEVQAGEGP